MRRVGRSNLRGVLAAGQRQDQPTLRTHPARRPREDIFCRSRTRYLLARSFPAFSAAGSGNRRNGGAVLAPAELAAVDPHPVQNHGQAPGDRDDCSTYPAPLSHSHAPRLQPRPEWGQSRHIGSPGLTGSSGATSGRSQSRRQMAQFVKGSWTPAAEERSRSLGRQASEKPRGRKPRAGVAHRCRACGLAMGI